jgi:DNA-binding IclR family transcriptional regulator
MSVVNKTLAILEATLKSKDEVSLTDLAKLTGLNRTTVHRISSILAGRGYLYQKGKGGKYSPGLKLLQYGDITNIASTIKQLALPYMQNLCDEIDETVNMSVLNGVKPVGIAIVAAERILQIAPASTNGLPLHCTAIGKILLAHIPDERIDTIISIIGLSTYTDNTTTDVVRLKKEIDTIRRDDVAYDDEEYVDGIKSVAAPIKGANGNVLAAISFVGPSVRISKLKMRQLAPLVKNCALKISKLLGYTGE